MQIYLYLIDSKIYFQLGNIVCSPGDDLLPNPLCCTSFYQCANGVPILVHCAANREGEPPLVFDPSKKQCVYVSEYPCGITVDPYPTQTPTESNTATPTESNTPTTTESNTPTTTESNTPTTTESTTPTTTESTTPTTTEGTIPTTTENNTPTPTPSPGKKVLYNFSQ